MRHVHNYWIYLLLVLCAVSLLLRACAREPRFSLSLSSSSPFVRLVLLFIVMCSYMASATSFIRHIGRSASAARVWLLNFYPYVVPTNNNNNNDLLTHIERTPWDIVMLSRRLVAALPRPKTWCASVFLLPILSSVFLFMNIFSQSSRVMRARRPDRRIFVSCLPIRAGNLPNLIE